MNAIEEILAGLEQFLLAVSTTSLSYDELSPVQFVKDIFEQIESKKLTWTDNVTYVPNIIHLFVFPTRVRKLQEVETIFSSKEFYQYIYAYIEANNYKLFDFLHTEIDILPGIPTKTKSGRLQGRYLPRLEWPNHKQTPSGLDAMVEATASRIIKVTHPLTETFPLALLHPINACAFRDYFLIVKSLTYLGRSRNVFSDKKEVLMPNDFAFARTSDAINKSVSRRHAVIEFRQELFFLKDLNSRCGTAIQRYINGWQQFIAPSDDKGIALANHDVIRLGNALLTFRYIYPTEVPKLMRKLLSQGWLEPKISQDLKTRQYNSLFLFSKLIKYFENGEK
ncbi:MAG: FHA domain-containing protein [Acidobacteria bacterium]|nr:FHA domain-containing protein [Acidobacteriota bacterium]